MASLDPDGCPHPVQVAGLCAVCGKELDSAALSGTSIVMSHSSAGIKVSESEAKRLDSESTAQLLSERRLALIIDLDQTIIHATVDPTVEEWMKDPSNPNYSALESVGRFKLGLDGKSVIQIETHQDIRKRAESKPNGGSPSDASDDEQMDGCWYYVKPRPGLEGFLKALTKKYELHVYTMGTRSYADCVCKLVDPSGTLFGSRILSRDENGSLMQKSLARLFPVDTSMVVIIDDRSDVWNRSPNLIKVIPYDFFVGIGDINGTFLPPVPSLPGQDDDDVGDISADVAPEMSGKAESSSASSSATGPRAPEAVANAAASASALEVIAASDDTDPAANAKAAQVEAAQKQAEEKAEQTQRVVIAEQVDKRPLAKMQEALEEKLSHLPAASAKAPTQTSTSKKESKDETEEGAEQSHESPQTEKHKEDEEEDDGTIDLEEYGSFQANHAVLKDDDSELERVQNILADIHEKWYKQWDAIYEVNRARIQQSSAKDETERRKAFASIEKPSVTSIISDIKRVVLDGCRIVFTGVIPLGSRPQEADIWKMAEEFGARCFTSISSAITHLVAAKPGTEKVRQAYKQGNIHVVYPLWLHHTVAAWSRQDEQGYSLPREEPPPSVKAASPDEHMFPDFKLFADDEDSDASIDLSIADSGEEDPHIHLSAMDWGEAADEVDAYLDDDDDDDETDGDVSRSGTRTPERQLSKRSRDERETANGSSEMNADSELSPLSKRRKVTEARAGQSMLKHSIGPDDASDKEEPQQGKRIPSRPASQAGTDAGSVDLDAFADDLELELDGS